MMSCGMSSTCPAVRNSYLLHLIGQLSSGFLHLCPLSLQEMRVHTNHMGNLSVLVTCLRGKVCELCQRCLMAKPKVNIIQGYSSPGSTHISSPPKHVMTFRPILKPYNTQPRSYRRMYRTLLTATNRRQDGTLDPQWQPATR